MLKIIREIFRPEPKALYLEPYFGCNYKCIFCLHGCGHRIETAVLGPALFERLKPVIDKVTHVHITGLGEPFLNPHLLDYLAYFVKHGKSYYINSNGSLIEDAHIELMMTSRSELSVSLDAGDPETYGRVRRNGNWTRVISTLEKVSRTRGERRSHYPLISLNYHINSLNLASLRKIPGLARQLGVDAVKLSWTVLPRRHADCSVFADRGKAGEIIAGVCTELAHHGIRVANEAVFGERTRGCWSLTQMGFVGANGAVAACCSRWLTIGNINDNRFEDIWNGMPRRTIALSLLNGRPLGVCASCPQIPGAGCGNSEQDFLRPENLDAQILAEKKKSIRRLPSLEGLDETFHLGVAALLGGSHREAADIFASLEAKFPDFFEIKNNLAIAHFYLGDMQKCRNILDAIARIPHNEPLIQSNLNALRMLD